MAEILEGESRDVLPCEITKEDVRPYFTMIDCSLRVLGSQFGLDPSKLTDLERCSAPADLRQLLLDECFRQEKITSWHQFVTVLEKPALNQKSIANRIRKRFGGQLFSRQDLNGFICLIYDSHKPYVSTRIHIIHGGIRIVFIIIGCTNSKWQ